MGAPEPTASGSRASEIVSGSASGGTNTSHTIAVPLLATLLEHLPADAQEIDFKTAVIEDNLLGKGTEGGRRRTYRYLRELYLLRPDSLLFRSLRDLWVSDVEARPLLAGLCALARDPVFRASSATIVSSNTGDEITSSQLAESVGAKFPTSYGESTLKKIGRNTFSSWEQTGHLESRGRSVKLRRHARCQPANVAFALLLGHLQGHRGEALLRTIWTEILDEPESRIRDLAVIASQQGMIDLRDSGGVLQVSFSALLRPFEGETL